MHIVDEFWAAPTWDEAIPTVLRRYPELFLDSARTRFQALMRECGQTDAARQLLLLYLEALQAIARQDPTKLEIILRGGALPKLSKNELTALNTVTDISSARSFMTDFRRIGMELLSTQALQGTPFWLLLFTLARKLENGISRPPQLIKTTVGVGHGGTRYRILKILPLSDGGFAVAAPYHTARVGSLMKVPLQTATGSLEIKAGDMIPFYASDRVKLSYHKDGFVQFSGENSSRILSGRDEMTGEPKGLGIISRPLSSPIQSGPSVGCVIWGLTNFEPWKARQGEGQIIFEKDDDCYTEPETVARDYIDGYALSFFVFPRNIVDSSVGPIFTGDELKMPLPMNIYHREADFRIKLISISPICVLGAIAKQQSVGFHNSDGFNLSSPGDGKHTMTAIYPSHAGFQEGRSLDYTSGA